MELAFLTSAVRRYFWIVVLGGLLGAMPGLLMSSTSDELYESRAVLLIAPPTQTRSTSQTYQGDPDRYVAGEISVLESLSDRVAAAVDLEGVDLGASVAFEQQPLTDVVVVIAKAPTAELAKSIADSYVTEYFVVLSDQLAGTQDPAVNQVDAELETIKGELEAIDREITEALRPHAGREVLPTIDQIAPALASEKATLITRYNELQTTRSELSSGLRVTSRVVREANLPTAPLATSSRMLVIVGGVAGLFVGLLAAVVVARLSRNVIDDEQAEEILGHDLVGTMPDWPELATSRRELFGETSPQMQRFLDTLGVRVEAVGQGADTVTAVVCGTRSKAGSSTLAAALAVQLASPEVTVLLVDADRQHGELSKLVGKASTKADVEVVDTDVLNLRFVTLAGLTALSSGLSGERRPTADLQLSVASTYADVVIVDGGALMSSASTVQLTRAADAVVLAIPRRQHIRGLETAAAELTERNHLLPVWVPVGGRSGRRSSGDDGSDSSDTEPVDVEERPKATATNGARTSSSGSASRPRARQRA